jgi:hypothetical protein
MQVNRARLATIQQRMLFHQIVRHRVEVTLGIANDIHVSTRSTQRIVSPRDPCRVLAYTPNFKTRIAPSLAHTSPVAEGWVPQHCVWYSRRDRHQNEVPVLPEGDSYYVRSQKMCEEVAQ